MLKIVLGFISLFVFTYIGKIYSNKLKRGVLTLNDLCDFNDKVINSVDFYKDDILSLAKKTNYSSEFGNLLKKSNYKKDEIKYPPIQLKSLDKAKNAAICQYLNTIGKSDDKSQLEYLRKNKGIFEGWYFDSIKESKKLSPIYVKIGFLVGLVVFIILI